jgi:hypothetical protein
LRYKISYEIALSRHPDEVAACIKQVRKGKAKSKNEPPETWSWHYCWATKVKAFSFSDILSGKLKRDKWPNMTAQERTIDEVTRSLPVELMGEPPGNRTCGRTDLSSIFFPPEVQEQIFDKHESNILEEKRLASLSPAQRQKEVQELLRQLHGPGLAKFKI